MVLTYILNAAGWPVVEPDLLAWATWMATHQHTLRLDEIDDMRISTVFFGLSVVAADPVGAADPSDEDALPVLFETMIFGGRFDGFQCRYRTKARAEKGHTDCVADIQRVNQLPVSMTLSNEGALCSPPFCAWAADHLQAPMQVFHRFRLIGFASKADAAIFMLSPWFSPDTGGMVKIGSVTQKPGC